MTGLLNLHSIKRKHYSLNDRKFRNFEALLNLLRILKSWRSLWSAVSATANLDLEVR